MPCSVRRRTKKTGPKAPTVAYVGARPIPTVPTPMRTIVQISAVLRPARSPRCPKIAAPRGRARKPTKYVEKASSTPVTGLLFGKNSSGKTSAAAAP